MLDDWDTFVNAILGFKSSRASSTLSITWFIVGATEENVRLHKVRREETLWSSGESMTNLDGVTQDPGLLGHICNSSRARQADVRPRSIRSCMHFPWTWVSMETNIWTVRIALT